ncbi:MAG: hypothetical protein WCH44_08325 [Betaproteobacteria bacterium]
MGGLQLDRTQELYSKAFVAEQVRDDALSEKQLAEAMLQKVRDNGCRPRSSTSDNLR